MNQQTMMHLGAELVLFCGLFYYTSRSMTEMRKEISELREDNQELRDYVDQNRPISNTGITAQQIQQLIQQTLQTQAKDIKETHQSETQQLQDFMTSERQKWDQKEQEYKIQLAQYDQKLQQLSSKLDKKLKSALQQPAVQASSLPPPAIPLSAPQLLQRPSHPPSQQPSVQQQPVVQQPVVQQQPSPLQSAQHPLLQPRVLGQAGFAVPMEAMFGIHLGNTVLPPQRTSSVIIEEETEDEKSDSEEIEIDLEIDEEFERIQREVDRSISKRKSKTKSKSRK